MIFYFCQKMPRKSILAAFLDPQTPNEDNDAGAKITAASDESAEISSVAFEVDDNTQSSPTLLFDDAHVICTWVDNRHQAGRLALMAKMSAVLGADEDPNFEELSSLVLVEGASSLSAATEGSNRSLLTFQEYASGAFRVRAIFLEAEVLSSQGDGGASALLDGGGPPSLDAGSGLPPGGDGGGIFI